jgi:hypothetical protein
VRQKLETGVTRLKDYSDLTGCSLIDCTHCLVLNPEAPALPKQEPTTVPDTEVIQFHPQFSELCYVISVLILSYKIYLSIPNGHFPGGLYTKILIHFCKHFVVFLICLH